MGNCWGDENNRDPTSVSEDRGQAKEVEKEIEEDKRNAEEVKKILFLGPGGCGKSTLFKQLRKLYGNELTEHERNLFRDHIYTFVMETMQNLVGRIEDKSQYSTEEARKAAEQMEDCDVNVQIDAKIAGVIKALWAQDIIRTVFNEEAKLKADHACSHFFEEIDRIGTDDYLPTDQDILLQRRPTTGLIEQTIAVDEHTFQLFDVGGQKNERRKWEHCFENVSIVIFVASLSAFDEPMYEDETTNSLSDALDLFEEICTSNWFVNQNMILILNKQDLFQNKIQDGVELKECPIFEDYKGEKGDTDAAQEAIMNQFRSRFDRTKQRLRQSQVSEIQEAAEGRKLYMHVTCAYDGNNVKNVFGNVKDAIVEAYNN